MTRFLLATAISFVAVSSLSQEINGLDDNVRQEVKEYAKEKVNEFNGHLSFIASKRVEMEVKDDHIREALNLFIGQGEESYDTYGNKVDAPIMQVSSINRRTGKTRVSDRPIKTYLNDLRRLSYNEVVVKSSDATYISELEWDGEGRYKAVLSYAQIFVGERDGIVVYRDVTKKSIEIYIEMKKYGDKTLYEILLGNVKVDATS